MREEGEMATGDSSFFSLQRGRERVLGGFIRYFLHFDAHTKIIACHYTLSSRDILPSFFSFQ